MYMIYDKLYLTCIMFTTSKQIFYCLCFLFLHYENRMYMFWFPDIEAARAASSGMPGLQLKRGVSTLSALPHSSTWEPLGSEKNL